MTTAKDIFENLEMCAQLRVSGYCYYLKKERLIDRSIKDAARLLVDAAFEVDTKFQEWARDIDKGDYPMLVEAYVAYQQVTNSIHLDDEDVLQFLVEAGMDADEGYSCWEEDWRERYLDPSHPSEEDLICSKVRDRIARRRFVPEI